MAKINTVFSLTDNVSNPMNRISQNVEKAKTKFSKLANTVIVVNQAFQLLGGIANLFRNVSSKVNELTSAYQYQMEQELKLEVIMKQRMNATQTDIQYIKQLASEEQKLGIYGDEMILQGAQELASFTSNRKALEALIPAMNDLIAQQYGYNASGKDFQHTADMMGKVLSGQTGALSRMGYIFSEEEKRLLSAGTEMQRASVLAKIITDNVGKMNSELAKTDAGQVRQLNNTIGDLKEQIGKTIEPMVSAFMNLSSTIKADLLNSFNNFLTKVVPNIVNFTHTLLNMYKAIRTTIQNVKNTITTNIKSIAVGITEAVAAFAIAGTIYIATHSAMVASSIASATTIATKWLVANAKIIASNLKVMATFVSANAPIFLTIAAVIALIIIAVKLGLTFEKVGEVIGGTLQVIIDSCKNLFTGITNGLIKFYNRLVTIADKIGVKDKLHMSYMVEGKYNDLSQSWETGKAKGGQVGKKIDDWVSKTFSDLPGEVKDNMKFLSSGALLVSDEEGNSLLEEMTQDYKDMLARASFNQFAVKFSQVTPQIVQNNTYNNASEYRASARNDLEMIQSAYNSCL